jgi:SAM-dependent methyltransferase
MSRPELTGHASLFYNAKEAKKYDSSSRMVSVQREITERAMELLRLPQGSMQYILDVGCGSGLSGQVLEENGHVWVGCDVSRDMLTVAKERMEETLIPKSNGDAMNDSDDSNDESDEEETPSTGDVMHHVSTGLWSGIELNCIALRSSGLGCFGYVPSIDLYVRTHSIIYFVPFTTFASFNTIQYTTYHIHLTGHGNWLALSGCHL